MPQCEKCFRYVSWITTVKLTETLTKKMKRTTAKLCDACIRFHKIPLGNYWSIISDEAVVWKRSC